MLLPEYLDLRMPEPPTPCPGLGTPVPRRRLGPMTRVQSMPDCLEYHGNSRWRMDPYECKCSRITHSYSGVSTMRRAQCLCGSIEWNRYPYHQQEDPRNLPPQHQAVVPSIQPGTMSAASCDFDADEILQFQNHEVVYRSAVGSGRTNCTLAALHGHNDNGGQFYVQMPQCSDTVPVTKQGHGGSANEILGHSWTVGGPQ